MNVRSLIDDRHGARPASGTSAHFDRKAAHHETIGRQRFEVVELLDMAISDLAAGAMALPDQARITGREILLLGVHERRIPGPAVGPGHAHAALEQVERCLATHAGAFADGIAAPALVFTITISSGTSACPMRSSSASTSRALAT